jgi:hypothetical protein
VRDINSLVADKLNALRTRAATHKEFRGSAKHFSQPLRAGLTSAAPPALAKNFERCVKTRTYSATAGIERVSAKGPHWLDAPTKRLVGVIFVVGWRELEEAEECLKLGFS